MKMKKNRPELSAIARMILPAIGMATAVIGLILTLQMFIDALSH